MKTDRRDALALCEAARTGVYRVAHRSSPEHRRLRASLRLREAMVGTRTKYISLVRALLRQQGLRVGTVDRVERFQHASQLRACVGLVPSEWSSGQSRQRGHITKAGNRRLRSLLIETACCMLRHPNPRSEALRTWALGIATRRGKRIAAVALARKLAGVLYALWRDGTSFGELHNVSEQAVAA